MRTISSYNYVKAATEKTTIGKGTRSKFYIHLWWWGFEPELDDSPKLRSNDHMFYQELIRLLRWAIELVQVDILYEVPTCPREGHKEQFMHTFSYLEQYLKFSLYMKWRYAGHDRNYKGNSWEEFQEIYRDTKEELPKTYAQTAWSHWVSLMPHVELTRSRQDHIPGTMYSSIRPQLFDSAKSKTRLEWAHLAQNSLHWSPCFEAITHLRFKLIMFGVPLSAEPTTVLCDNNAVVNHSRLHTDKKRYSITYHYVRLNVAAGVMQLQWLMGNTFYPMHSQGDLHDNEEDSYLVIGRTNANQNWSFITFRFEGTK